MSATIFDPERRQNYRADAKGNRIYDEVPPGFEMDEHGELVLSADATPEQVMGAGVASPCGPREIEEYEARLQAARDRQSATPAQKLPSEEKPVEPAPAPVENPAVPITEPHGAGEEPEAQPVEEPVRTIVVGDGGHAAEAG